MDRPGEGPRTLGRNSSQLGNGNLPHKPPIPDTTGPKTCLGWALEWHHELLHYDTPTALPEGILRAVYNLFVFQLPLEEDIKWVAKSGMSKESSLTDSVKALPDLLRPGRNKADSQSFTFPIKPGEEHGSNPSLHLQSGKTD